MLVEGHAFRSIWVEDDKHVGVIDQSRLPHRFGLRCLSSSEEAAFAIREMWVRGRALIDRLRAIKTNLAVPQSEYMPTLDPRLLDVVDRLNELTDFVECAWLASRSVEDKDDRGGLSVVLDHAAAGLA